MAEAFVKTIKRDYARVSARPDAASVHAVVMLEPRVELTQEATENAVGAVRFSGRIDERLKRGNPDIQSDMPRSVRTPTGTVPTRRRAELASPPTWIRPQLATTPKIDNLACRSSRYRLIVYLATNGRGCHTEHNRTYRSRIARCARAEAAAAAADRCARSLPLGAPPLKMRVHGLPTGFDW